MTGLIFRARKAWFFHKQQVKLKGIRTHLLFLYHAWLYFELARVRRKLGFKE